MMVTDQSRSSATRLVWLLSTLGLATLTLWIPAYWPVAGFETSLFLLAGMTLVTGGEAERRGYFPLYVFCFVCGWAGLQLLTGHTVNRFATERAAPQWMSWAALYYAAVCLLRDGRRARRVRVAMVWSGCGLAVEAILQAYLSPGNAFGLFPTGYHEFVMGPIVYHTHYAVLVEILLPIALYLSFTEPKRTLSLLAVSAILLASLVVSASRGGLVVAAAEVVTVMVLLQLQKPKAGGRAALLLLALAAVTTGLALIVGFATTAHRFQTDALLAGRLQFAVSTLHMIRVHPFMGWGMGSWPSVYPAFATFAAGAMVNQAHTDWLQWTAEGGLPVGLAMGSLAVWAWRPVLRSIWGIGVFAVLVHAMFDYPFSRPAVGAWPVLMLAMVGAAQTGETGSPVLRRCAGRAKGAFYAQEED